MFVVAAINGFAQETMMFKKVVFTTNGDTLNFRVLYPKDFDSTKTYPILFFLHGSGERGNDNESQLMHGAVSRL